MNKATAPKPVTLTETAESSLKTVLCIGFTWWIQTCACVTCSNSPELSHLRIAKDLAHEAILNIMNSHRVNYLGPGLRTVGPYELYLRFAARPDRRDRSLLNLTPRALMHKNDRACLDRVGLRLGSTHHKVCPEGINSVRGLRNSAWVSAVEMEFSDEVSARYALDYFLDRMEGNFEIFASDEALVGEVIWE